MRAPTEFKKKIVVWFMVLISLVTGWMMIPGDINPNELSLSMVMIPAMVTGIIAWLTGEATKAVQKMKHLKKDEE